MTRSRTTFYFILLSATASFFNYVVYPVIARLLSDEAFIEITVALALFTQISSFTLSIVALAIGLSKQKNGDSPKSLVEKLQTVLIHLFLLILVTFIIASPLFINQLRISSTLLLPIAMMLLLSISMSVISGYLNGKQKLVKLGFALAFSALLQFVVCVLVAAITRSGVATLYAMAIGAALAIILIYWVYRDENLPSLTSAITHKFSIYRSGQVRKLVWYTVLSSLSVLVLNILLILDLLIINNRRLDAELYTGIYIVSRVVFFGGALFIWPFLSRIDIYKTHKNTALLVRLTAIFLIITIVSIATMTLFGKQVTYLLLGNQYGSVSNLEQISLFAILYKFIYLMLTAIVLYFIVIRSYWAVVLPLMIAIGLWAAIVLVGQNTSTVGLLKTLNATSAIGLIVGLLAFARSTHQPIRETQLP